MAVERTFSILKPDATKRNLTGAINAIIEGSGLRIVAQKRVRITREQAETFYGVHRERPFFGELVAGWVLACGEGDDECYGAHPTQEHDEGDQELAEGAQVGCYVEAEAHGVEGGCYFEEGGQEIQPVRDHEREGAHEDEQRGQGENGEGPRDEGAR